ncbi:MAG: hypothetical protein C0404_00445 [Verrucomicrobia bacterium]|nr:hypothetical protein [Verrucomicrobiota bacterium]
MQVSANRAKTGRPPKFREPSRPVTVTLPERILEQLAAVDGDRAQAIVKATEAVCGTAGDRFKPVELVEMSQGKCLIVVGPNKFLKRISWLRLIEIAPGRHLLTIPSGTVVESLEIALSDLLHDPDCKPDEREKAILHDLIKLIGHQRRTKRMSKAEILIVDLD